MNTTHVNEFLWGCFEKCVLKLPMTTPEITVDH